MSSRTTSAWPVANPIPTTASARRSGDRQAGESDESYGQALAIDPGFSGSHQGRAWAFAMLGQFESALSAQAPPGVQAFILSRVGRFREAAQLLEQARRDAVKAGNNEEQGQLNLVSAMLAIERSDYRRAVQECDAAERVLAALPKSRQRSDSRCCMC